MEICQENKINNGDSKLDRVFPRRSSGDYTKKRLLRIVPKTVPVGEDVDVIDLGPLPPALHTPPRRYRVYTPNPRLYPGTKSLKKHKRKTTSSSFQAQAQNKAVYYRRILPLFEQSFTDRRRRKRVFSSPRPNPRLYTPVPRYRRAPPPPPACPRDQWPPPAPPSVYCDTASRAALRLSEQAPPPNSLLQRSPPFFRAVVPPQARVALPAQPRPGQQPKSRHLQPPQARSAVPPQREVLQQQDRLQLPPQSRSSVGPQGRKVLPAQPRPSLHPQRRPIAVTPETFVRQPAGPVSRPALPPAPQRSRPSLKVQGGQRPRPGSPPQRRKNRLVLNLSHRTSQLAMDPPPPAEDRTTGAPSEYLAEFLSAIMQRQYAEALKYCRLILEYEPNNSTARGFYPLLRSKLAVMPMSTPKATIRTVSSSSDDSPVVSRAATPSPRSSPSLPRASSPYISHDISPKTDNSSSEERMASAPGSPTRSLSEAGDARTSSVSSLEDQLYSAETPPDTTMPNDSKWTYYRELLGISSSSSERDDNGNCNASATALSTFNEYAQESDEWNDNRSPGSETRLRQSVMQKLRSHFSNMK